MNRGSHHPASVLALTCVVHCSVSNLSAAGDGDGSKGNLEVGIAHEFRGRDVLRVLSQGESGGGRGCQGLGHASGSGGVDVLSLEMVDREASQIVLHRPSGVVPVKARGGVDQNWSDSGSVEVEDEVVAVAPRACGGARLGIGHQRGGNASGCAVKSCNELSSGNDTRGHVAERGANRGGGVGRIPINAQHCVGAVCVGTCPLDEGLVLRAT